MHVLVQSYDLPANCKNGVLLSVSSITLDETIKKENNTTINSRNGNSVKDEKTSSLEKLKIKIFFESPKWVHICHFESHLPISDVRVQYSRANKHIQPLRTLTC